ncbi:MAG: hypothetical protein ABI824_07375 [Acidobacteriota bacterium]
MIWHPSTILAAFAVGLLAWTLAQHAPGGARWSLFVEDPAPVWIKSWFLWKTYLWPAVPSFIAIVLFQLQFRLAASGAGARTVFSICVIGCFVMLSSVRIVAFAPSATPGYVLGMALGYTTMGRVYAIQMRTIEIWAGKGVSIPSIVWRGNVAGIRELERNMRMRMQPASNTISPSPSVSDRP